MPLKLEQPSKIFTCSLTDFFHPAVDSYRHEAWDIIRRCPQHTFQILTKRPERIVDHLPADWGFGWENVWLGTSIGSANGFHRLYDLEKVESLTKFISFEPLYENLNHLIEFSLAEIDWVIIGGESGNDKGKYQYRACKLEWIEGIVDEAKSIGIPVFVKQLGTHLSKQLKMSDRHGGNIEEFPEHLQIRQFPA